MNIQFTKIKELKTDLQHLKRSSTSPRKEKCKLELHRNTMSHLSGCQHSSLRLHLVSAAVGKQAAMLTAGLGQTAPGEEHTAVHPQPTALVCPPHTPTWSWIGANRSWDRLATEAAQVPGHSPAPRLRHTHPPVCTAAVVQSPDVEATQVPSNRQLV